MLKKIRKSGWLFCCVFFSFYATTIYAKPYLTIKDVKSQEYPYITVEISVSNEAPLEKLDESHFSIFENGWKAGFFRIKRPEAEKNPKKLALLIDASKSLSTASFQAQIKAAQMLVSGMSSRDQVSIISFGDSATTHCGLTNSREQIGHCLKEIKQGGKKTVLYDALYKALTMKGLGQNGHVILFTDGKEEKSIITLKEIHEKIKTAHIPVYIIGAGKGSQMTELGKISRLTGGEIFYAPDMAGLVKIYQLLGSLLDGVFQIQYISQANAETGNDKKSGTVRLEVRMENGTVRDQDTVEFRLPQRNFLMTVKSALDDERFLIFLGSSFILMLIVLLISHITSWRLKIDKIGQMTQIPFFETLQAESTQDSGKKKYAENSLATKHISGKDLPDQIPDRYHAYIIEKEGPHTGRTSKIKWNVVTIGHGNENSIVINDPTVSYNHAKIVMIEGEFYIYDMISESGVYLNGKKLLRPKSLNDFDEIGLGRTKLLFRKASR